jgi:hypothetical protein
MKKRQLCGAVDNDGQRARRTGVIEGQSGSVLLLLVLRGGITGAGRRAFFSAKTMA